MAPAKSVWSRKPGRACRDRLVLDLLDRVRQRAVLQDRWPAAWRWPAVKLPLMTPLPSVIALCDVRAPT